MKTRLFGIFLTAMALIITIACKGEEQGEKLSLRLNPQEGEIYQVRVITDQKIVQTIEGEEQEISQLVGIGYSWAVDQVDPEGGFTAQVTYDWIRFAQDGPLGKIDYDSDVHTGPIPELAVGYAAVHGTGFSLQVSSAGDIQEIIGVDEMLDQMLDNLDLPDDASSAQIEQNLERQFGEAALKENMATLVAIYPQHPVAVGDSWSKTMIISLGFPMILENRWTLVGRENGVASIEVRTSVKPNPDAAPLQMGPVTLEYELSGTQQGTMELDERTGWTLSANLTQALSGKITMNDEMSWPISSDSTITLETVNE